MKTRKGLPTRRVFFLSDAHRVNQRVAADQRARPRVDLARGVENIGAHPLHTLDPGLGARHIAERRAPAPGHRHRLVAHGDNKSTDFLAQKAAPPEYANLASLHLKLRDTIN